MSKLIKRKEAAKLLGVSPITLDYYAKTGKIPRYKFGENTSGVFYKEEDIDKFIKEHKKVR